MSDEESTKHKDSQPHSENGPEAVETADDSPNGDEAADFDSGADSSAQATADASSVPQPEPTVTRADSKAAAAVPATTPPTPAVAPRRSDWFARTLVLLLWLVVLGLPVAGWFYGFPLLMDREQRLTTLEERIAGLASSADTQAQVSRQLDQVLQPLDRRIEDALRQVQEGQRQLNADAARQRSSIAAAEAEVRDQLRRYDERFVRLDERLSRLTATDRRAWLVAESAFMVRLAGQRLAAARDVESALALLRTADDLLLEADDPLLDAARRAIAVDVAALRALPVVDIIGIDARINALLEQTGALSLIKPAPTLQMSDEGSFLERAKAGWEAALAKLSDYLVIRRRSDELASMLTPEWVTLARQNLRMLLEQAQIAMLSANRELYDRSLERAEAFAGLFVENDPERVAAMTAELRALRDMPIARDLPDLVDSRRALSEASRQLSPEVEG